MNIKQLKSKRAAATKLMSELVNGTRSDAGLTAEDQTKFNSAKEEVRAIDTQIENLEELRALTEVAAVEVKTEDDATEFRHFLQTGETRSQTVGTNSQGGFTAGASVQNRLIEAVKSFGGMVENSQGITTATGTEISYPTMSDVENEAVIKSETDARRTGPDLVFDSISLNAFVLDSGIIKISNELVQDSSINIEQVVINALSKRIGRKLNKLFSIGNGTTEPAGITTQTTLGKTAASATIILADELLDLQFSVDEAYQSNAKYSMNKNTLLAVRKLKDGQGNYLVKGNMIFDKPIQVNNDLPDLGAGKKAILYGDLNAYLVRTVQGINIFKFAELYQETNEIGFKASGRFDGTLLDPAAVKHLIMKAS